MVPAYAPPPAPTYERYGVGNPPAYASSLKQKLSLTEFLNMWEEARGAEGWGSKSDFKRMFDEMRTGDEVWIYDTLGQAPLSGMRGLVLLRNGNIVADIVFLMS